MRGGDTHTKVHAAKPLIITEKCPGGNPSNSEQACFKWKNLLNRPSHFMVQFLSSFFFFQCLNETARSDFPRK